MCGQCVKLERDTREKYPPSKEVTIYIRRQYQYTLSIIKQYVLVHDIQIMSQRFCSIFLSRSLFLFSSRLTIIYKEKKKKELQQNLLQSNMQGFEHNQIL